MSSRSSSSNSFSSFSDLKDLQAQLRRQNADLAQAKADAIIVKDGQESTNKLKQKAASLAKFTSAAENALKVKALEAQSTNHFVLAASDNDNARGTNARAKKQDRRDHLERADRAERSNEGNRAERGERTNHYEKGERTNHHEKGERTNRAERGERTNRAERGSNRRERNDGSKNRNRSNDCNKNEIEQQRLDRALNRLQRKAMDLNEHAQKDQERKVADKSELDSKDRKASNKKQAQQRLRSNHEERKDQNRPRQDHESKNKPERNAKSAKEKKGSKKAPLLDGKYFDLESLKLVREHQDNMSYQSRRLAYRKLSDLDQAILALMQSLFDDASTGAEPSAAAAVTHDPSSASATQATANTSVTNSADTAAVNEAAGAAAGHSAGAAAGAGAGAAVGSAAVGVYKRELLKDVLASDEIVLKRDELKEWVESEVASLKARGDNVPKLEYPESLPVSQRREEIVKAIKENQVVIIAGETGSGKTTQIPKMCLEAGFGIKGLIGHTQPRRLAARAVASRIAEELHEQLGKSVSYKVRFTDISSPEAYIKLMTDGILLSELASDRQLLSYDVIIIDEAHERSLNIDFLLGYLKTLLIRRPELKLIITSATIDVERFSEHFGGAPIIEVSGRTYPVEVVYMPLMEDHKGVYIEHHDGTGHYERDYSDNGFETGSEERNAQIDAMLGDNGPGAWTDYQHSGGAMAQLRMAANSLKSSNSIKTAAGANTSGAKSTSLTAGAKSTALKSAATALRNVRNDGDEQDIPDTLDIRQGILQAVHYLMARGRGDILVFLPGERDILEISQFLRKAGLKDTEIVPLYARLAASEQNKIFTEHTGVRIVLSTNVAETSLTVPGIKYVIDPGLARISRYSSRTKVQRLPIERVSQASANQRKGRCGRVSDGICVRLYSKDDFDSRPQFTDPEILRTNLASVLLQMASLRLGRVESFPFIDAPQQRQVSDGLRLLDELGATVIGKGNFGPDGEHLQLTQVGRTLSRLPCDPRLGRMIIEASKYRALSEVLVIVSALAVMDPREYPIDKKEAATQYHKRFFDEKSDFLSYLKLYEYIRELQGSLSNSAMRRQLKQEFISFLRVREWLDVHRQLRASAQMLGLNFNDEKAEYEAIHRSLIAGLLSHIGMVEPNGNNYIGARGTKFLIFPGSPIAKKPPKWLCAAELAETTRLFARTVAAIDPGYAEAAAPHLIKNSYNEPHWSKKNGCVMAYLTRSIYGLPIVQKRLVQYQDIDPKLCHELMIRDGFVEGNIDCNHRFYKHNLSLIDDVEYLEDKVRRRDLLVDASSLEQFYAERIPSDICNIRDFDKWWRTKSKEDPYFLDFSYETISRTDIMSIEDKLYPEFWSQGSMRFKLSYVFDIGSDRDGVTVHIPITVLNQVKADAFLWQIDGLRQELFASLIRSLPKRLRRNLIPAPEYAKALEDSLRPYFMSFIETDASGISAASVNNSMHASTNLGAGAAAAQGGLANNASNSAKGKNKRVVSENLFVAVAQELTRMGGEIVTAEDFDKSLIEPYLFVNFSVEGVDGKEMAFGKDFAALSSRLQGKAREVLHQVVKTHQVAPPATSWEYGTIKREQVTKQGSLRITAYPALTDHGDGVTLELYDNPQRQERAMRAGSVKLIALSLKTPTSYLETHLPNRAKLSMYYQPLGSIKELIFDLMLCAISNIMERNGGVPWDEDNFNRIREIVRGELNDEALAVANVVEQSLVKAHELKRLLKGNISFDLARSYADLNHQLDSLIYKGFISDCGPEHLKEMPRYLQAALERVQRLNRDVVRDQMYMRTLENLEDEYEKVVKSYHTDLLPPPLKDVRWMIEELRVSYFAQHLGVIGPISDKRIYTELQRIQKEYPPHK
ncbi:ATP-dependent RNA helicase HrpA [Anaerobiospirillum succiniciproducens]|uniref:ATP-dependent RNA helicase HrpA n=1 Tax=Anaerobiospirillum succiniciproducens TaxID=13335 RepID=UPI0023578D1B|nr:ATP-dependent RNA helicase HrpA [Anaerobiospirillum succiniciproducens]MCI6862990.1 ATP-dependent RNA helicase HrpA [Anaerobiospirillum succiniciproducens]